MSEGRGRDAGLFLGVRWNGGHRHTLLCRSGASRRCVVSCLSTGEGIGGQLDSPLRSPVPPTPNASIEILRDELGELAVGRFVAHYLSLLDQRVARIGQLIEERRFDAGITILLTLETSSQMVGAVGLCARAAALREALDLSQAEFRPLYQALLDAVGPTRRLLAHT